MSVTLKLLYDERKLLKKTGTYPYKLRVTFERQTLEYQTLYSLSKEDHLKLNASHLGEYLKEVNKKLKAILAAASAYCDTVGVFAFYEFERDFINTYPGFIERKLKPRKIPLEATEFDFGPYLHRFRLILQAAHPSKDHISYTYNHYIRKLIQQGKIGSALNYLSSYSSLKKFRGNVPFQKITDTFLVEYENWMVDQGKSLTYVSINLIPLRCIFNEAAEELKIINKATCYPFGRRKYQIPTTRNTKKAFDSDELNAVYNYKTSDPEIKKALDYWWFLYFGNGMNLKDAALRKYEDIEGDFLVFRRAKTSRLARTQTLPISVYISDDLKAIIERRGNKDKDPKNYIFPILCPGLNPLEKHDAIKGFIRFVNRNVKKACKEMGLNKQSTTKVTRHSFATQQKRNGASHAEIRDMLGHQLPQTTDFYMDSFELPVKKAFARNAANFKNEVVGS
jgi:integrase/recombinase XerD